MIPTDQYSSHTHQTQTTEPLDAVIRLAGGLMSGFGILGYLAWALNGGLVKEDNWVGVDFHVYYQVAQVLRNGGDIYTNISPPYVYPPLLGILVIPLSLLSVSAATIAWKLLQHICLLVAGALLVNLLPQRIRPLAVGILFLGLLTTPLQDEIQVGESNSLVFALIMGAVWLIARMYQVRDNEPTTPERFAPARFIPTVIPPITPAALAAGVLLATATSIKVLPVLLIAYCWWRGPRNVALVATAGFLVIQGLLFVLTPSTANYWFTQFPALFGQAFPYPNNQSLNALISRATLTNSDPTAPTTQVIPNEALRPVLTWIANLLTLAATIAVLWAAQRRPSIHDKQARTIRFLLEIGLVLLTIHLVSGSTWLHHLIDLAVPILALIGAWWLAQEGSESHIWSRRALLYGATLGLMLAVLLHLPSVKLLENREDWLSIASQVVPGNPIVALIASSMGTWVIIGLWIWITASLLRPSPQ